MAKPKTEKAKTAQGDKRPTLRQRAHQLSLYLEPPDYEQLRSLAFHERVKMHDLMLEGIDLMLKKRGQRRALSH